MGSGLGVGEDTAATVGSGAAAGVSVGRGVVATSGWRGVSWDCIRSDRSACGAAVGPATDGGSCPAVHAAKINEASRAAAISLDILWALSFNSLQPGIPHEAGVAFSARDPQPSEPPDALAHSPDGELPGRPGSPEIVVVDDGPPESAPGPASPGVVAGGVVADGELAPLVHRRGRSWSGHSGRRPWLSPWQYRRLLRWCWAHGGQRKGPVGWMIRMERSVMGKGYRRPAPAVSEGYGSCSGALKVASAPSTMMASAAVVIAGSCRVPPKATCAP